MPRWGLTAEMRASEPWGLSSELLETKKVITDPVHGDIFITELERRVLDSAAFQRLRRVRQLGTTHLVYPGATHTRFAHSLGTLCVSQDLVDAVVSQELGPHPKVDDLFAEWKEDGESLYLRRLAEATVLARLGGLLHDFTHVAYGHTIEDDLGLLVPHDENFDRFEHFWSTLDETTREALEADELDRFLRPLILSKFQAKDRRKRQRSYAEMVEAVGGSVDRACQYEFVADIVGNTICADLIDYLRRDHLFSGLPLALGQRYLAYFYVTPTKRHRQKTARMVLRIQRDGRTRTDVVTELLKHLRYRYELSERALVHHAKLAADAMVGKVLVMWRDALWIEAATRTHAEDLDGEATNDLGAVRAALQEKYGAEPVNALWDDAQHQMENELRQRGDDGFLEWLRDWTHSEGPADGRRLAIRSLTEDLLNRRLFKPIAHIQQISEPESVYERYKDTENRRALEQAAARFAEVKPTWHVLLWIPDPRMRLKIAEVLVDTGEGITTFVDHERTTRQGAGAEIYDAHRELWGVSVFVEEGVKRNRHQVDAILAWLAAELEVRVAELGLGSEANPWDAPDLLAARRVLHGDEEFAALRGDEDLLLSMLRELRRARGTEPAETISERIAEMKDAALATQAVHNVVQLNEYVALKGREPKLFGQVLEVAAYDPGGQTLDGLIERFKAAAELELESLGA